MPKGATAFDGKRLRKARLALGLTQDDFNDIGIQQSQISKYENQRQEPSPDTARKLAIKVKVSLDYLFSLTDNPNEELSENDLLESADRELSFFVSRLGEARVKALMDELFSRSHSS